MRLPHILINTIAVATICALLGVTTETYASVDQNRHDLSQNFSEFLSGCSVLELAQIAMSMRMLPDLEKEDFGAYGLAPYDTFADSEKAASKERPLRPLSFNDVSPEIVVKAANAGRFKEGMPTVATIKRQLIWIANNKATYLFREKEDIDYHSIVQWVAEKRGVPEDKIATASTFNLEKEVTKAYFAQIWDKLSPEQRSELLNRIEIETGTTIANKAGLVAMSGAAAIGALSVTVSMAGFAFYTTMSVVICTVAGWFGITLPFAVYLGASSTVALLSGPIGWAIAGAALTVGGVLAGMPSADKTAAVIMTINSIKAKRIYGGAL